MDKQVKETVLAALEFQAREWAWRLDREPKTHNRKPNLMRKWLADDLCKISAAQAALGGDDE